MPSEFLNAALELYDMGVSLIPVEERGKKPLVAWEIFMKERASVEQLHDWWGNGRALNIGAVHGKISNNYVLFDIDGDQGAYLWLRDRHPELFTGRVIISGSRKGFHIPLMLGTLPDFGFNAKGEPIGNRTWKAESGSINIRARGCQSVVPPSVHESGEAYDFIQEGPITWWPYLDDVIASLDTLAPQSAKAAKVDHREQREVDYQGDDLKMAVMSAWTTLAIFQYFGAVGEAGTQLEDDDNLRILGQGGLMIAPDGVQWVAHEDGVGGGPFEAWGYKRFGHYSPQKHFRQVLVEMAWAAGLDILKYTQSPKDLAYLAGLIDTQNGDIEDRSRWTTANTPAWITQ
jgi:hypothetical protein